VIILNFRLWGGILAAVTLIGGLLIFFFMSGDQGSENNENFNNNNNNNNKDMLVAEKPDDISRKRDEKDDEDEMNWSRVSHTTGTPLSKIQENDYYFFSVIENSQQARPQAGLASADIVLEMEVEGTTTRFLALFNDEIPNRIGPVRSARHYFLPFPEHWNADFYHFGKSKFAESDLANLRVNNFDGTSSGYGYYERDLSRKSPHNAFLIKDRIETNSNDKTNDYFTFSQNGEELVSGEEIQRINIAYNSFTNISYVYDQDAGVYNRSLEGVPHNDLDSGKQVRPSNVVFMYADHSNLGTKQGHIDIDLDSGGDTKLFSKGQAYDGVWNSNNGSLEFLDNDGEPLMLSPGKTWIQVIDNNRSDIASYD